jgi:hypothetical protein
MEAAKVKEPGGVGLSDSADQWRTIRRDQVFSNQ